MLSGWQKFVLRIWKIGSYRGATPRRHMLQRVHGRALLMGAPQRRLVAAIRVQSSRRSLGALKAHRGESGTFGDFLVLLEGRRHLHVPLSTRAHLDT